MEFKEFMVNLNRGRTQHVLLEGENLIRPKNKKMAGTIYLGSCNHGHTVMIPWVLLWSKFFFQAHYYFTPKTPFQDTHQRNRYLCRHRRNDRNSSTSWPPPQAVVAVGDGDRGGGLGGTVAVGRESVEVRLNEIQWKCKK